MDVNISKKIDLIKQREEIIEKSLEIAISNQLELRACSRLNAISYLEQNLKRKREEIDKSMSASF